MSLTTMKTKTCFVGPAEERGFFFTRVVAGEHQPTRNGAALLCEMGALRLGLRPTAVISLLLRLPLPRLWSVKCYFCFI